MNVYIKSFNRPYYLERCIQSILSNVVDSELSIIVLDDGTNPLYLEKIKGKYPAVEIRLSPFYTEKVNKIKKFLLEGEVIREMEIPTQFWLSNIAENKEDYFLLLEDDIWITEKLHTLEIASLMKLNNMCMLKLFHFDNPRLISGKLVEISPNVNLIRPKFFTNSVFLFKKLVLGNPLKIWSILKRFNVENRHVVNYYTIYNVAGAIFSTKYYSHLWKDFSGTVNENEQLIKALEFYNTEKTASYGVTTKDILSTSFSSSATNMFAEINFNPFIYNDLLNKAWYEGDFNPMSGYPKDILESDIEKILSKNQNNLASVSEWSKWVNRFKSQYQQIGFSIN